MTVTVFNFGLLNFHLKVRLLDLKNWWQTLKKSCKSNDNLVILLTGTVVENTPQKI